MNRLAGDAQRVTDPLPRPPTTARHGNLIGLDPLRQPAQRDRGTQAKRRVIARNGRCDVINLRGVILN
jgi:hypothetical protein